MSTYAVLGFRGGYIPLVRPPQSVVSPPATPTGLAVTATGTTTIAYSWSPSAGATSYSLRRSTDSGATWSSVGLSSPTATSGTDSGLAPATLYLYEVSASNAGGQSAWSLPQNATTQAVTSAPGAPTITTTAVSSTQVLIAITPGTGGSPVSYSVERSVSGQSFTVLGTTTSSSYTDITVTAGGTYTYRATATNAAGTSGYSNTSTVTTPAATYTAPTDFQAIPATTAATLYWTKPAGGQQGGYTLERAPDNNGGLLPTTGWVSLGPPSLYALSYADTGLTAGTRYWYRLRANYAGGHVSAYAYLGVVETWPAGVTAGQPRSVFAAPANATRMLIRWQPPLAGGQTGYVLERAPDVSGVPGVFSPVATGLSATTEKFFDTTVSAGTTYWYRVKATDANGTGPGSAWCQTATPTGPTPAAQYLLNIPSLWSKAQAEVAGNTAMWQAVKANINTYAARVLQTTYQANQLITMMEFGLAYRLLKASDPTTANKYADRVVGMIKYGLNGSQTRGFGAFKYLGRGDGSNRTFTIPDADVMASTVQVATRPVLTVPVTRGTITARVRGSGQSDLISSSLPNPSATALFRISNTFAGPADYVLGTDYTVASGYVTWVTGKGPATGATYYVVYDILRDYVSVPSVYPYFLKVSNTSDGNADYTLGTDCRFNSEYQEGYLDWNLPTTNRPALGATYYVTCVDANASIVFTSAFSLSGTTLTLTTAPTASQAVAVQYLYGTFSNGTTTLGYQQTYDGTGGFCAGMTNGGYAARFLVYMFQAADWIWDYPLFPDDLKAELALLGRRWYYVARPGPLNAGLYRYGCLSSNYGNGQNSFVTSLLVCLANRDPVTASLAQTDCLPWYTDTGSQHIAGLLQAPSTNVGTWQDGYWPEGFNYGPFAAKNILYPALALEALGLYDATPLRAWAGDTLKAYLYQWYASGTSAGGAPGVFVEYGDWNDTQFWPAPLADKTYMTAVTALASDPAAKAYGNWYLQNAPDVNSVNGLLPNWEMILFRDTSASATDPGTVLAPNKLCRGYGMVFSRKNWLRNAASTFVTFHASNMVAADHQPTGEGEILIYRGPDPLLVNVCTAGVFQGDNYVRGNLANFVQIDDGGAGLLNKRYSQNPTHAPPYGCTVDRYDGTSTYTYGEMNVAPAWCYIDWTGAVTGSPVSEVVRSVLHVLALDYVFVHDRATTTQAVYRKQLQWHVLQSYNATVSGNTWAVSRGASKLFGATYSDIALTTDLVPLYSGDPTPGDYETVTSTPLVRNFITVDPFYRIRTNPASPTAAVRYTTALQAAASSVGSMDASAFIAGDGQVEGVILGDVVAMFGRNGAVSTPAQYSYTGTSGHTVIHYVTDLTPGQVYALGGAASVTPTASSGGVITFTTTASGSIQTVTIN